MSADPPQVVNTGIFAGPVYQNVVIMDSQFIEINYYLADPSDIDLPPLPPIKHSSTFFTGQDNNLQKLKDHFTFQVQEQRKIFLLHGLGGIGKTQICLKFIEENPDLFSDIFWIDASSEKSVEFVLTQDLMVYDGADGHYSVVENFLPPGNGGNVMITSRNIGLKRIGLSKNSMEVHGMEDEDAISLLLKSAMLDDTDNNIYNLAQQLVLQLDGIPLAIDQAGSYMRSCGCSIDGYLELYARYKNELMRNTPGFGGASDYGTSTYGTWDISMKKMEDIAAMDSVQESVGAQSAIKLLRIFAFLDHVNIPQELFKNAAESYMKRHIEENLFSPSSSLLDERSVFIGRDGEWDKLKFLNGIQVLLSFSFIRSHDHLYSMHLLVEYFPWIEIKAEHWDEEEELLRVVVYERKTRLGSGHVETLTNMANLASVYRNQGRWDEAEKLQMDVINALKTKLGSDHPDTLTTMSNLASTYWNQGKWDEAEKIQMDVMNARKTKLGLADHPDTLTIMANLASTYRNQGRWGEAEKLEMNVISVSISSLSGPKKTGTGPDQDRFGPDCSLRS
ncbi:P-loop containing nucleoside triphosphate hydrolase protein [Amanita rubescens]|nr:P-loop containing nucleoside triphosphate hydrolase protein [Amanita rubescens]